MRETWFQNISFLLHYIEYGIWSHGPVHCLWDHGKKKETSYIQEITYLLTCADSRVNFTKRTFW